jgi:hypothetical protein
MSTRKNDQPKTDRYVSDRVYDGVRPVSRKDAAINRHAIHDAFARMEKGGARGASAKRMRVAS